MQQQVFLKELFLLLFITLHFSTSAQDSLQISAFNFEDALKQSSELHKPVLLMCYEDWCGHCEKMMHEVFIDSALIDFYNKNYLFKKQDMTSGSGPQISKKYYISSYPTFIVLDSVGETLYQFVGEYKAEDFIEQGKLALLPEHQIPYLKKQYQEQLHDSTSCYQYLQALSRGRLPTQHVVDDYFKENKNVFEYSSGNWKILSIGVSDISSEAFQFILNHQEEFSDVVSKKKVDRKIYLTCAYNLLTAANAYDTLTYFSKRKTVENYQMHLVDSLIFVTDLNIYEHFKNRQSYQQTALSGTEKYVWTDAVKLRKIAEYLYYNFNDETTLLKAKEFSQQSIFLKPDYYNALLKAKILFKTNDKAGAKKAAEEAKVLAEKTRSNTSEADALIQKCN